MVPLVTTISCTIYLVCTTGDTNNGVVYSETSCFKCGDRRDPTKNHCGTYTNFTYSDARSNTSGNEDFAVCSVDCKLA